MRRVAVFGNAGGGKSTLARQLAEIYVDLPLFTHYVWVTKRLVKGVVITPEGWPENSPMWSSTINSYRVLRLCHEKLTPRYRQLVAEQAAHKRVHHLRSPKAMKTFVRAVIDEYSGIP